MEEVRADLVARSEAVECFVRNFWRTMFCDGDERSEATNGGVA